MPSYACAYTVIYGVVRIQLLLFFQVCEKCETIKHAEQELWWSHVSLEIPLFSNHFNGGRLALRCIAEVETLYQEGIERILYSEKDPIPERGKFLY